MIKEILPSGRRTRGRPPREANGQVVDQLLDATELLLREGNHYDLTERQIADAAQVNAGMIHYYFGDKEGLIFAVIARYSDEISEKLKELDTLDPATPFITRRILGIVVDAYYAKLWIGKIGLSEFAKNTAVKQHYIQKYGSPGRGQGHLRRTFDRLVELGVYDRGIDTAHAALCMFSIILAPHTLATLAGDVEIEMDDFRKQDWLDFVADLFERKLRLGKAAGADS